MKGNTEIVFDTKIKTTRGSLYCVKFIRSTCEEEMQKNSPLIYKGKEIIFEKAHRLFRHARKEITIKIVRKL